MKEAICIGLHELEDGVCHSAYEYYLTNDFQLNDQTKVILRIIVAKALQKGLINVETNA